MDTLFTGQQIIALESVGSTNDYAGSWVKENAFSEGLIITTEEQTAGKGQRGSSWQSEKGKNLVFSLVLKPVFLNPDKQFYLSKITSLAVLEMLGKSAIKAAIKWPNDIYVTGRKIAGILIENTITTGKTGVSIIGVGVNINQKDFAPGLNATSFLLEKGTAGNKKQMLEDFCSCFEANYLDLKAGKTDSINKKYHNSLLNYGVTASYRNKEKEFQGMIKSVLEDGRLELMNFAENKVEYYEMKEITQPI